MPFPKTPTVVVDEIKNIMLYRKALSGIEISAKACHVYLKAWGERQEIPDKIPTSWKTVQKFMTEWRNENVYDDIDRYGLEQTFLLGESLGEGANQIPWKHAGRARELTEFYLTELGIEPQIGLIRQYIRVSQIDLEWANVQQKALKAEVFWAHERLKDIPDVDEGSIRYEELQLIYQTWKHSANSPEYQAFQKRTLDEGLIPWSATVPAEMIRMLPQFDHVARSNSPINADTSVPPIQPALVLSVDEEGNPLEDKDANLVIVKSEPTEESFLKSIEEFEKNVVITELEPVIRNYDDFEPPLPDTPEDAMIQLLKSDAPDLQQIKYDEDGKPIKPWEKDK